MSMCLLKLQTHVYNLTHGHNLQIIEKWNQTSVDFLLLIFHGMLMQQRLSYFDI